MRAQDRLIGLKDGGLVSVRRISIGLVSLLKLK